MRNKSAGGKAVTRQARPGEAEPEGAEASPGLQRVGRIAGPLLFAACLLAPLPEGLKPEARAALAATLWTAAWWLSEAVPLAAASLLPLLLLPALAGIPTAQLSRSYGNPVIFLFLGGFLLSLALKRSQLHRRLALRLSGAFGHSPMRLLAGFSVATAVVSMWMSNTSAMMVMLPVALAVLESLPAGATKKALGWRLMLGLAYGASLGGLATPIGTPPNLLLSSALKETLGLELSFARWMAFGVPLTALGLGLTLWLLRWKGEGGEAASQAVGRVLRAGQAELGPWSAAEIRVAAIFGATVLLWVGRPFLLKTWLPLADDAWIAILGALALFVVPSGRPSSGFLLHWDDARGLPWGTLLLFGGGLALAEAFDSTGLSAWLGGQLHALGGLPPLALMLGLCAGMVLLSEVASNTAAAAMMLPVAAALAKGLGLPPATLMAAVALSASGGFMLPVATPPNTIASGTGLVPSRRMLRHGFWLDLAMILLFTLTAAYALPWVLG